MALVCRLCGLNPPIKESHVIPKFAYTQYVINLDRGGAYVELAALSNNNKQLTYPWFCLECEAKFGEKYGAAFIKKLESDRTDTDFTDELLTFAVGMSLRVCMHNVAVAGKHDQTAAILGPAIDCWKAYLRGDSQHITPYTQHAYVLEADSQPWDQMVAMELSFQYRLVYTQIGPLIIFGRTQRHSVKRQDQWALDNSKVSKNGGKLAVLSKTEKNYTLLPSMSDILDRGATYCRIRVKDLEAKEAGRRKR